MFLWFGILHTHTPRGQTGQAGGQVQTEIARFLGAGLERCHGEQIEYQGAEDRLYFPGAYAEKTEFGGRKNIFYTKDDDFKLIILFHFVNPSAH